MTVIINGTTGITDVDGSASTPAITGTDTNTGIFFPAADTIAFTEGGTESMRIDSSGNVGIGTASPSSILNVRASSPVFRLETGGAVGSGAVAYNAIRDSTGSDVFVNGFLGLANCYQFSTTAAAGFMRFLTGAQVEAMRIDSSGNVGIGTSLPLAKLDVRGNAYFAGNGTSRQSVAFVNTGGSFEAGSESSTGGAIFTGSSAYSGVVGTTNATPLQLGTNAIIRATLDTSGFTQFSSNNVMPYQGAPTSKAAATTLTASELITGILNTTGTTYTITLPTGTNIEGALTWSANNVCLDWFVINTASGTITIGANGNTTLGSLTVATGVSAQFRIRRTAANTFTVYRLG